ncbi:HmuY family protein [Flavobacterium sp.]|uniref:HmuY family protein n=1 Tax=Flavobacterium sp. TaxID=239 RepID=UPI00262BEFC6|nr:HmuY family protein [Flavobacterium sp.]MDD3003594.1 HmuY family protein [Flavobacterium sp.]
MKKSFILFLSAITLAVSSCSDDDSSKNSASTISFSVASTNLTEETTPVQIMFSEPTSKAGTLNISYTTTGVTYGTDFTTDPEVTENIIVVPFDANVNSTSFNFKKLVEAIEGEVKNVVFKLESASINASISGNITTQLNFNETASLGTALAPLVGGPNQENQVYVDLSSGKMISVPRVSWDLGFYCGGEFRVALNNSVKMSVKELETTNIDEVQVADETMFIGQGSGFVNQVDEPAGLITNTAIKEVSDNNDNNKVYLLNLGSNPSAVIPAVGSEGSASGTYRGWKKVRFLKSGNDYKIQYADINSTTHQEVIVTKNAAYNFTFFSFTTNNTVSVEPQKNQWDLNFTTFTNVINMGTVTPYHYADFVITNLKGNAKAYQVMTSEVSFDAFSITDVVNSKFTEDQRNIGANWRSTSVTGAGGIPTSQFVLRTDRFYVIKDPAGNIYKLKFTGGASESGERGYPTFQYVLVQ